MSPKVIVVAKKANVRVDVISIGAQSELIRHKIGSLSTMDEIENLMRTSDQVK